MTIPKGQEEPRPRKGSRAAGAPRLRAGALGALTLLCGFAQERFDLSDGDRVVFVGNAFAEREGGLGILETALARRFPGRKLSFRNLGWSGDAVDLRLRPNGFPALARWLEDLKPAWIVAAYGMNESFEGEGGLAAFEKGLREHLELLEAARARIVLLSPVRHEALGPPLPDPAEHNRALALYAGAIRRAAAERGHAFVDLFALEGTPERPLTENGIHLSAYGYARAAEALERALGLSPAPWTVEIDAAARTAKASGSAVSGIEILPAGLRFRAADALLPLPGGVERRLLKVAGLSPGRYALRIDGVPVAEGAAGEWAGGVAIARGPAHDRVGELRRTVVRKNEIYFHRFRPQNAEYIYGTRSRVQGANVGNPQFASEFRYLESLAAERDAEIHRLALPPPARYDIVRE